MIMLPRVSGPTLSRTAGSALVMNDQRLHVTTR